MEEHLASVHCGALVGWFLGLLALWFGRHESDTPHRPSSRLATARLIIGIWGRRLCIFATFLTGIWLLHRQPEFLRARPMQLKLLFVIGLIFADQWFRDMVAPAESVEPMRKLWLLPTLLGCFITAAVLSWM